MTADSGDPTRSDEPYTESDSRMAEILRGGSRERRRARDALRKEGNADAGEVLGGLNVLDFIDGVVGDGIDIPERLGDYTVRGLLGRGGMGTVYEAFQESLEREVALKVLSPAFNADVTMRERFRSEARATASLHHEHIVPVYDFGETAGVLYFAMEKVNGVSLDRHIAASRRFGRPALAPRVAAARFAGVADALAHAHRRGILHRDVKPGNILVGPDGTMALADFGLSKIVGDASRSLTKAGAFLGTPAYAPPEQARGREPSPQSDLYGLGVTIFETVSGELPLYGKTPEAQLDALLNGTPKRLRAVQPKAPKDLEAVLEKLLQKDPTDRYPDGEELARDLLRVAEGDPVHVRRRPIWVRAWRKARKNPTLTATIGIAVVLGLIAVMLAVVNRREAQRADLVRFENVLQSAITTAARETGPAAGPPRLLSVLIGRDIEVPVPPSQVTASLERALALLPGDPDESMSERERVAGLRAAYRDDPLPAATRELERGAGQAARRLIDPVIVVDRQKFEERDDAAMLRLFRLYVTRAVASMTVAVDDFEQARRDLEGATFIRSSAFFPELLLVFVDWDPASGSAALIARVESRIRREDAPPGADRVAGHLLASFAGLRSSVASQIARPDLPFPEREALHAAAVALLGEEPEDDARELCWWSGLEHDVALIAQAAVGDRGQDSLMVERELGRARTILREDVAPGARMQSWAYVFDLIEQHVMALSGHSLPAPGVRIRAWVDLMRLQAPSVMLGRSNLASLRELLGSSVGDWGKVELATRLALRSGEDDVVAAAREWYRLEPGHPDSLLCRFKGWVQRGEALEAAVCGAELLQRTRRRSLMNAEIVATLRAAERGDPDRWRRVREAFERYGD